jgi:hypothetical protein
MIQATRARKNDQAGGTVLTGGGVGSLLSKL